jgi:hypothetical protein
MFAGGEAVKGEAASQLDLITELAYSVSKQLIGIMLHRNAQNEFYVEFFSVPIQRILGNRSASTVSSPSPACRTRSSQEWAS